MGSSVTPPPPPGFTLDQPSAAPSQSVNAIPPPPPGFTLDKTPVPGEQTNDIGKTVIVPKEGESFQDTMKRAAQYGSTVTQKDINEEGATAPKKVAQSLGAAAGIGVAGPALLAGAGEAASALGDVAIKHLAGNVLPGLEGEAAKQTLMQAVPKAIEFAESLGKLGIGAGGAAYLLKTLMGGGK